MKTPALLWLIILTMPLSARACLNDRYTDWAEKEFRSHYGEASENVTHDAASQNPALLWRWKGCALAASGAGMIWLACRITRRRAGAAKE